MRNSRLNRLLYILLLLPLLVGIVWLALLGGFSIFELPWNKPVPTNLPVIVTEAAEEPTPEPGLPQTLVTFRLLAPADTPAGETLFVNVLDEVTGLGWNAQLTPMEPQGDVNQSGTRVYLATLPFNIGAMVKYRYERQSGDLRMAEHLSDGSAVRYRMLHVTGQAAVEDTVSRWTDTTFSYPVGRIQGQALDVNTGQPIPNLLVAAAGAQTITGSDGSFMLEGLPPGVHNLVVFAMDGAYQPFQQGARVAEGSTTPTPVALKPAEFVNIIFVASVPEGTPPVVPLRLAGNLLQLGDTFANLGADMSSLAATMPVMAQLPDGRYKISVPLPVGADIRYKYTLGDGFWNAEHNPDGSWRLRQLIVPDHSIALEENIESWYDGMPNAVTFDVQIPADTPAEDFIALQFNPLLGWTQPVPMWKLQNNRWAYVLYSPLHLPGLSYRYCRNGQCNAADDAQTAGANSPGRPLELSEEPQTLKDEVEAWAYWSGGESAVLPEPDVNPRSGAFATGVQFRALHHPSWTPLMPAALDNLVHMNANWLVLSPTWGYGRSVPGNQLPILAPQPGRDASWPELAGIIQQARGLGMYVALYPEPRFQVSPAEWWNTAPRDLNWWQVWFEQYRTFVLHHADLAARSGAPALVLGGEWLAPALPGGLLPNGEPSGVPDDAEVRWRELIAEARQHYSGQIAWALPASGVQDPPAFQDAMDRLFVELFIQPGQTPSNALGYEPGEWLDGILFPSVLIANKPVTLATSCSSNPDLQIQVDCYAELLRAAAARNWISGFVVQRYLPPVALQDASPSVHGKPASEMLAQWYQQVLASPDE